MSDSPDQPLSMPPTAVAPKGRVLCVDDEPNIVRSLDWLLRGDFDVFTATSAEDALALLRRHDFDVVISDQRMPQVTGVEFLTMVKRIAPRALRILLTGYADTEAMLGSINEAEVFRYIRKPWDTTELPRVVAEAAQIARLQPLRAAEPDARAAFDAPMLLIDDDEATAKLVREVAGEQADLRHARSLDEAAAALAAGDIGIVVSETRIGRSDAAGLLQRLKQQQPDVVTVVIAREVDADTVWTLINKGQVFRFVPKPVRREYLAVILRSAQGRRRQQVEKPQVSPRRPAERESRGPAPAGAATPGRATSQSAPAAPLPPSRPSGAKAESPLRRWLGRFRRP